MANFAIRVEDIHTYYGNSYILQGLSLAIAPGETVAVLGRNGVGKTTLVRSIIGFTPPVRGRIFLHDDIISGLAPERIARRGVALVPQGRRIFRSLTVEETLSIASRQRPETARQPQWSLERVYGIFPRLRERRHQRSETLSGGEQQMLVTGRALVGNPQLLMLDEPTEGLSPLMVQELQAVLRAIKGDGVTLLIVEHRISFALALADRIYLMTKGRVAQETSPQELRSDSEIRLRYLGV
jgi:branched-chain amino acid transport system ATP-binding protein